MSENDLKKLLVLSITKGHIDTDALYKYERDSKIVETTVTSLFNKTKYNRVVSEPYEIVNVVRIGYSDGVPDVKINPQVSYIETTKSEKTRLGKILTVEKNLLLKTHITCGFLKLTLNHDESVEINDLLLNYWKTSDLKKVSNRIKVLENSIKL